MDSLIYLIAFGGNLGDRERNAHGSLSHLKEFGRLGRQSKWRMTQPLLSQNYETSDHELYLNFVFEFESSLKPHELYSKICEIEDAFGHDRVNKWRPRAVDFDLLFVCRKSSEDAVFHPEDAFEFCLEETTLRIPHPEIWNRGFLIEMIECDLGLSLDILKSLHAKKR